MTKLVLTHAGNFTQQFGAPALGILRNRLRDLQEFDQRRGLSTEVLYVDEQESSAEFGVDWVTATGPEAVKTALDEVFRRRTFDFLLIVGGHAVVPFFSYPNPVPNEDDTHVYSDNGYATAERDGIPVSVQRAVGRLPCGSGGDPSGLWRQLDEILAFRPKLQTNASGVGLTADAWTAPSRAIATALGIASADVHVSPPIDVDADPRTFDPKWVSGRGLQLFNLHGSLVAGDWYGQRNQEFPPAYRPALVPLGVEHCLVGCEACYGADIVGTKSMPRTEQSSLCLRHLAQGAIGFCGSTTIAYGGTNLDPTLSGADLLVRDFLEAAKVGQEMGKALLYAKSRLVTDGARRNGALDPVTEKTLLQFVLYGDPSIAVTSPVSGADAEKAIRSSGVQQLISLASSGELRGYVRNLLPTGVTIEASSPGSGAKAFAPPTALEPGNLRLVHEETRQLRWEIPAIAGRALPDPLDRLGFGKSASTDRTVWHVQVYKRESDQRGFGQFLVRVLRETGGVKDVVIQAVSR